MKYQSITVLALSLTLFIVTGCEKKSNTPPAAGSGEVAVAAAEFDSLHDLMEELADNYKFLRRNTESGDTDELLQHAAAMRDLVAQAKTMTPEQVEDAADADKEALEASFHKHLDAMGPALDAYETAINADDRAAAEKAVNELHEAEEEGHEALGVKDD